MSHLVNFGVAEQRVQHYAYFFKGQLFALQMSDRDVKALVRVTREGNTHQVRAHRVQFRSLGVQGDLLGGTQRTHAIPQRGGCIHDDGLNQSIRDFRGVGAGGRSFVNEKGGLHWGGHFRFEFLFQRFQTLGNGAELQLPEELDQGTRIEVISPGLVEVQADAQVRPDTCQVLAEVGRFAPFLKRFLGAAG